MIYLENILIGNVLELTWRIHEFFPDLVGKLDSCDKVANAKTKAHRVKRSSVISTRGGRLRDNRI